MVPGAEPLALPPICVDAAIEQRPMTHKTAIRRAYMAISPPSETHTG
jgi:hypothetical protein